MRFVFAMMVAASAAVLTGCGSAKGPVQVTPQVEAEQKQSQQSADDEERAMRKNRKQDR